MICVTIYRMGLPPVKAKLLFPEGTHPEDPGVAKCSLSPFPSSYLLIGYLNY